MGGGRGATRPTDGVRGAPALPLIANADFAKANTDFAKANTDFAKANTDFAKANAEFRFAAAEFRFAAAEFGIAAAEFRFAPALLAAVAGRRDFMLHSSFFMFLPSCHLLRFVI